jgi:hypothetical protein
MDKKNKAEEESASNTEEDIEIDFSAMNKVNSIRTSSNQSISTQTSTRNRRKSSSIRDKYMNLGK